MIDAGLAPGVLLAGRYRVESRIDYGGLSRVHRAHDEILDRDVAVVATEGALDDGESLEARAARISHPAIVRVFDAARHEGRAFVVMELVAGTTLRQWLAARHTLPWEQASDIVAALADGLEVAHEHGFSDISLRPETILLTPMGEPKLALLAAVHSPRSLPTEHAGESSAYLAPERLRGAPPSKQAQVYALGALLYELLAGRPPFPDEWPLPGEDNGRSGSAPPPRELNAGIPFELQQVVMRALSWRPEDRPISPAAVARALRDLDEGGSASIPTATVRLSRHLTRDTAEPERPGVSTASGTAPIHARPSAAPEAKPKPRPSTPPWRNFSPITVGAPLLAIVIVAVALALALHGRGAPSATQTTVPNLVGQRISAVTPLLLRARLRPGSVSVQTVSPQRAGTVIGEQPRAGSNAPPGTKVSLVVGVGP